MRPRHQQNLNRSIFNQPIRTIFIPQMDKDHKYLSWNFLIVKYELTNWFYLSNIC